MAPAPITTTFIVGDLDRSASRVQDPRRFALTVPEQELTSTIHDSLRVAIVSGQLAPNQRINQDAVARELGVSKTPVREALRWLERDGLVRLEPNRGAFVAEFTDRDLFEIYELRELLEPHAAAIACAVATRADVAELRDLRDRIAAVWAEDPMEAFDLNREFHHRLCAPCQNGLLTPPARPGVVAAGGAPHLHALRTGGRGVCRSHARRAPDDPRGVCGPRLRRRPRARPEPHLRGPRGHGSIAGRRPAAGGGCLMCGIAGILLSEPGPLGESLVKMCEAMRHRGADSTGFALYGEPVPSRLSCAPGTPSRAGADRRRERGVACANSAATCAPRSRTDDAVGARTGSCASSCATPAT